MTSTAPSKIALALCLTALGSSRSAVSQVAQCPAPLGGTVTCEQNQAASCKIANNKVDGRCQNVGPGSTQRAALDDVLSTQLGRTVRLTGKQYETAAQAGRYVLDGTVVTFSIPDLEPRLPQPQPPPRELEPIRRPDQPAGVRCSVVIRSIGLEPVDTRWVTVRATDPDEMRRAAIAAACNDDADCRLRVGEVRCNERT